MNAQQVEGGLNSKLADVFGAGFIIIFGLWLNFWAIPHYIISKFKFAGPPPEAIPSIFSLLMVLLGIGLLVTSLLSYLAFRGRQQLAQTKKDTKALETMVQKSRRVSMRPIAFVTLLLALLYTIFLREAGFLLGTSVLIIVLFKLFGGKKWWQGAILGVCVSGILWGVFRIYLHVALPTGFWERFFG